MSFKPFCRLYSAKLIQKAGILIILMPGWHKSSSSTRKTVTARIFNGDGANAFDYLRSFCALLMGRNEPFKSMCTGSSSRNNIWNRVFKILLYPSGFAFDIFRWLCALIFIIERAKWHGLYWRGWQRAKMLPVYCLPCTWNTVCKRTWARSLVSFPWIKTFSISLFSTQSHKYYPIRHTGWLSSSTPFTGRRASLIFQAAWLRNPHFLYFTIVFLS